MLKIKKAWAEFCQWLHFGKPTSATLREWRFFRRRFKKKAPIRYFLVEKLPSIIRRRVGFRWRRFYLWFVYRLHPRHRYHVIKTELKPGYYEVEDLMLHAVFTLVTDFVEIELGAWRKEISKKYRSRERGEHHIRTFIGEFENDPMEKDHVAFYQNLLEVYTWWKDVYPSLNSFDERSINPSRVYCEEESLLDIFGGEDIPTLVSIQTTNWLQQNEARSVDIEKEVDTMLKRAIDLRHMMWT